MAYFNLKWSYNITSIHNKVWSESESMQSAAIGSSTTIINPDPGLVLLTDSRTLHVTCYTGRHGHVMSSEVLGAQQEACFHHKILFLGDVRCLGPAERLLRITREPAAYIIRYSFPNDQKPDLRRLETNSFIVRTRRSMIAIVRSVMCAG